MDQIRKKLKEQLGSDKSVFLFTGDKESTLLLDLVSEMNVSVVFIDTGYHFEEVMEYVRKLGSRIEILKNEDATVDWTIDMNKCCAQRKVEVLSEYLKNVKAECIIVPFTEDKNSREIYNSYLKEISGLRILKPMADLSQRDIWMKIKEERARASSSDSFHCERR